jgi:hypothetical protein
MVKTIFIFSVALFITLITMWKVEASPPIPPNEQLVRAPFLIEYQKRPHAVFDYGGLYFLFEVTKTPISFPQCNAVRTINNGLMIVGADPNDYVFFTRALPITFKTDHNPLWDELVKKSCAEKSCE